MKKKIFAVLIVIFFIIIIIFIKNNYKNLKVGNNKDNKSVKETEEYILNINSYNATIDVTVESNKNQNKYLLKQEHSNNNEDRQIVLKPENIEGTEITYNNGTLVVNNSQFNLNKIYESYPYISDNSLWLSSFIEEYKNQDNSPELYEENGDIVLKINKKTKYCGTKKLYLEKGTGKPKKMIIQDENNNDKIYILYNEINIF